MLSAISQRYLCGVGYKHVCRGMKRTYAERRRRKGDGTKTDIFEERSAASQEEYFRKETARQLKKLREEQKRGKEDVERASKTKEEETDKDNGKKRR